MPSLFQKYACYLAPSLVLCFLLEEFKHQYLFALTGAIYPILFYELTLIKRYPATFSKYLVYFLTLLISILII